VEKMSARIFVTSVIFNEVPKVNNRYSPDLVTLLSTSENFSQEMKLEMKQENDIKREIKEEPMDSFSEAGPSSDLMPVKKEEIKNEPDIKKESDGATPGPSSETAASSSEPSAASKLPIGANKVTFAPEELKKALEPPLMKLYNQVTILAISSLADFHPRNLGRISFKCNIFCLATVDDFPGKIGTNKPELLACTYLTPLFFRK
jgi:hypothetical protein